MKFIKERLKDYNIDFFLNELCDASKQLGFLEAKIYSYHFDSILIPLLQKKEALSSMYIEGTQSTINDVFEEEIRGHESPDKAIIEVKNHTKAIIYGSDFLKNNLFTHDFIKNLHKIMLSGITPQKSQDSLGNYKNKDNKIVNSFGTTIFVPPSHTETKKYMDELLDFMNDINDNINPLIKAAIIHSQFESIHPFFDGNGRVGRLLISLYFYKAKVINFPFFYISEAFSQEKNVYYRKLTDSRNNNYNEWIRFFLKKCIVQSYNHINYIDSLNELYERTKHILQSTLNSPKFDDITECLFTHPILTSSYLSNKLNVTVGQAKRYLDILEEKDIIHGDDKKRNRTYYFLDLLDLARRS